MEFLTWWLNALLLRDGSVDWRHESAAARRSTTPGEKGMTQCVISSCGTTAGSIIHDATLNNKPRHHYFQLLAQIASDYFLSKGGTDDFRSWVSTNASPLLSLPVKIVNPPFLTYRPNVPPQSGTSIFFSLSMFTVERRSFKEKKSSSISLSQYFPGNELCASVNGRKTHTHPKIRRYLFFSFSF